MELEGALVPYLLVMGHSSLHRVMVPVSDLPVVGTGRGLHCVRGGAKMAGQRETGRPPDKVT